MNPVAAAALGSLLRWVLALGAGYLVKAGIWSEVDATSYVTAAALALLSLGWSVWQKRRMRARFLTALSLPAGSSEGEVLTTLNRSK